jgi:hypothetical protein
MEGLKWEIFRPILLKLMYADQVNPAHSLARGPTSWTIPITIREAGAGVERDVQTHHTNL